MSGLTFYAGGLLAKAEVNTSSEGDVAVGSPLKIETVRMLIRRRVQIGGSYHGHYSLALFQRSKTGHVGGSYDP